MRLQRRHLVLGAILTIVAPAGAQTWSEFGDAGDAGPDTAQITEGAGVLTTINFGTLNPLSDSDIADLYAIRIADPDVFSASVVGATNNGEAGGPADTRMFLFDAKGRLVVWNDDFGGTVESQITDQGVFEADIYYLALTTAGRIPQNASGVDISLLDEWPGPAEQQRRGDPTLGPLASWGLAARDHTTITYTITLTGAEFARDLAGAEDYWVPQDFATVQAALNGAVSGDTIHITPGTYAENELDFLGKALTLRGAGMDYTVIDATSTGRVIAANSFAGGTVFECLTLTNGAAANGAAIQTDASFIARQARFLNNGTAGVNGAVLRITDGDGVLEACEIDGAAGTGQSIAVDGASASLAIRDSLITGISQTGQDAILAANGAAMTLERTRISGNAASRLFARAISGASIVMQSCILDDNTLSVDRLIGAATGGTVDIFNTTVTGNTTPTEIFAPSPNIRAFNSIISGNIVPGTLFPSGPVLHRCIFPGATGDNLAVNPRFLDAAAGDFRLAPGSPAVDAGDSRFPILEAYGATDFAGNDRLGDALAVADTGFADGTLVVDIGAYEAPYDLPLAPAACPTDLNGDGVVDGADLGLLLGAWGPCN